jgi:hypothetical protein
MKSHLNHSLYHNLHPHISYTQLQRVKREKRGKRQKERKSERIEEKKASEHFLR